MAESHFALISATVACSALDAFRAWVDPVILPQWLAPPPYDMVHADVDARIGGQYRHDVVGPDGKHVVTGEYLEITPERRILKSWNYSGPNPAPRKEATFVEVEISPLAAGSVQVTIRHSGLRDETEQKHYQEGWFHCLERQKRLFKEG